MVPRGIILILWQLNSFNLSSATFVPKCHELWLAHSLPHAPFFQRPNLLKSLKWLGFKSNSVAALFRKQKLSESSSALLHQLLMLLSS